MVRQLCKFVAAYAVISPLSAITTLAEVFPELEPLPSIVFTRSCPSKTLPNTTCLPSSHAVFTVVIKNCEPFVFGPALAMDSKYGSLCFKSKFSSLNLFP